MNVYTVKKPEKRIDPYDLRSLGIISYGRDNLYPQRIRDIISCSETGMSCLNRHIQFVQGNGFADEMFSATVINRKGKTADDLLSSLVKDISIWGGFAVHVNYNLLGEVREVTHVPFENCRLSEENDSGEVLKIAVHYDWTGGKKRGNIYSHPTVDTIDYIDVFNPVKEVVFEQIQRAGGISNYKGQIFWYSTAGDQEYPTPIYDCVVSQLSTEEGLGNISNRNVRNGFATSGLMVIKKGINPAGYVDDEYDSIAYRKVQDSKIEDLKASMLQLQGDTNTGKIAMITVDTDEDIPQFINFQSPNFDKEYTVTTQMACEKIYASFGQEIWHRLRMGSIGFSTDILRDAFDVTSSVTASYRLTIERAFDKIFKHWYNALPTSDFTIQPLKFVSSETPNNI